jgi:hypothetical protein
MAVRPLQQGKCQFGASSGGESNFKDEVSKISAAEVQQSVRVTGVRRVILGRSPVSQGVHGGKMLQQNFSQGDSIF